MINLVVKWLGIFNREGADEWMAMARTFGYEGTGRRGHSGRKTFFHSCPVSPPLSPVLGVFSFVCLCPLRDFISFFFNHRSNDSSGGELARIITKGRGSKRNEDSRVEIYLS